MGKCKKWLFASMVICAMLLGAIFTTQFSTNSRVEAAANEVVIENVALKNRLLELLGKNSGDKLYDNDFVTNDHYKAVLEEDPNTHIESLTAEIRYLNLDGIGIDNVIELAKFEWPETLAGISLARNDITNEDLPGLIAMSSITTTDTLTYNGHSFTPKSNVGAILKKINLNFNKINLSALDTATKDNTLLLFGMQNIPDTTLITEKDAVNVLHYIRALDVNYLSYNIKFTNYINGSEYDGNYYTSISETDKEPLRLIDATTFGKYKISVSSTPRAETSYFYGYNDTLGDENGSFRHISIAFAEGFYIERGNPFVIPFDLTNLNNWASTENKIIIKGYDHITAFSYDNASTKDITTEQRINTCVVTITGDGITEQFSVDFVVRDTIKPKIALHGKQTVYISRGKTYIDPGYRAYDPISNESTDGDDLYDRVRMYDNDTGIEIADVNTSKLGTKNIRYVVSDLAGNVSIPVVRTVIILEQVLDTVDIRINDEKISINQETTIIAEPGVGTQLDKYTDYKYVWYLDGVQFRTTTPIDNISKKTSVSIIFSSLGEHELRVVLTAKQISDNAEIEVESTKTITVGASYTDNETLLLAIAIAILLIILIITLITIMHHRKRNKSTHHKTSAKAKKNAKKNMKKNDSSDGITVIKNYQGGTNGSGSTGNNGGGGGNENNRLPETDDGKDRE